MTGKSLCAVALWCCAGTVSAQSTTGGAGPAAAQQSNAAGGNATGDPASGVTPGDIVVTAQKKSESLQRVPAAVSVVGTARLSNLGVTNLSQIGNLVPGISVVPVRTQSFVFVRGVGQTLTSPNADAAVATNLNGVYLPAEIAGTAFFDVDRIELLPGPQGTLYGRNSTGGVINITSRTPKERFGVDGFVEVGNYDRRQLVLGVDVPLGSTLSSRTAGTIIRHGGYFNNGEDDQRTSAIRETLVWRPSGQTTVTGVATYTHDGGIGNLFQNIPSQTACARCADFDPRALGYVNRVNTFEGSLQVDQSLNDALTLTYLGGYSRLKLRVINSIFIGPPLAPLRLDEKIEHQSHELRLAFKSGNLDGLLGLYYFDQDTFYQNDAQPTAAQRLVNPFDAESHGEAVFGQGSYSVQPELRLTAGFRVSRTVKSIDGFNSAFNAAGAQLFLRPFEGRRSLKRFDWKVGFEYDLMPQSMLYANVSTGFTPGGFSTGPAVIGQLPAAPFKEVTLRAYVAGIKNRLADNKLTLNIEGFYYDYKNYQVSARDLLTAQNLIFNASKATIYGAQFDSRFKPARNDDFTLGVTWLHAEADRLRTPVGNYDGFSLPYSPKWTVNAFYQRSFDLTNGAQLRANVNFKYTSGRWALYTHAPGFYIRSNTHTDATFGYYASNDRWYVQAFVRNLEDRLVKTACGNALPGPAGCFFEPPRTYGGTVGFKF